MKRNVSCFKRCIKHSLYICNETVKLVIMKSVLWKNMAMYTESLLYENSIVLDKLCFIMRILKSDVKVQKFLSWYSADRNYERRYWVDYSLKMILDMNKKYIITVSCSLLLCWGQGFRTRFFRLSCRSQCLPGRWWFYLQTVLFQYFRESRFPHNKDLIHWER